VQKQAWSIKNYRYVGDVSEVTYHFGIVTNVIELSRTMNQRRRLLMRNIVLFWSASSPRDVPVSGVQ
jgi:hypothetical protein